MRVVGRLKVFFGNVRSEALEWLRAFLRTIPGEVGCWLRRRLYGFKSGRRTRVLSGVMIYYPSKMVIGSDVGISAYCQFNAGGGIEIGDGVLIGPGSIVWSQNHAYESLDAPIRDQGYTRAKVVIENDVWIGAGSIVLPGVRLAQGTVVAAGSVVTKSSESYTVIAGVPARVLRMRHASAGSRDTQVPG